jgi:hypothetical protein
MEGAHFLEAWHDLYVMLGTSSAALMGLLFVATSLHLDEIVSNISYRTRTRNNSYILIFALVEAAVILTPQPPATLSGLIVLANLVTMWLPFKNVYRYTYKDAETGKRGGWNAWRSVVYLVALIFGAAGGILLLFRPAMGLFLVTTGYVLLLVNAFLNAWSIMIGIGQMEIKGRKDRTSGRKQRSQQE